MRVRCIEIPDGYTSKYYVMTIGKLYTVLDRSGSTYMVRDDEGTIAFIAQSRFEEPQDDQRTEAES